MDPSSPEVRPTAFRPEDRLTSWKEIAAYFNRDVTTVQRWEKREGMPVHRHLHDKMGSVSASRTELDAWALGRNLPPAPANAPAPPLPAAAPPPPPSSPSKRWTIIGLAAAGAVVLSLAAFAALRQSEYLWRNPIADARFQLLSDSDGMEQAAAISRDGNLVAFLSDRDGSMDVWLTQIGSGDFHNVTRGSGVGLVNPQVRVLGFSPDGAAVTFWDRKQPVPGGIGIWAAPVLGGTPQPYLQGAAEFDWSPDGSRVVFHRTESGDPMFVTTGSASVSGSPIFKAPEGIHCHFPLWSPDAAFVYFVRGSFPDKLDIWRIAASGGTPERITMHDSRVSHPVFLDKRTLLYLATDSDGSGPWLYGMDVERRAPHRLTSGLDRFTSLAASADGRRLVVTRATPKSSLWRLRLDELPANAEAVRIPLPNRSALSPRLGPNYIAFVSDAGKGEGIWKLSDGVAKQIWNGAGAHILGSPAISKDGERVAVSVRQQGRTVLYAMDSEGTGAQIVAESLDLAGSPSWTPDGQSLTVAANDHGAPHLYRVKPGESPVAFLREYSLDASWSPDGAFAVYSGPDIGTTFSVKAVTAAGLAHPLPPLTLTRGARHLVFVDGGRKLVFLRGEIDHQNLWQVDLETSVERQITNLAQDFSIRDFDVSPDGRDLVVERIQERSEVVLLDRAGQ